MAQIESGINSNKKKMRQKNHESNIHANVVKGKNKI